jgi:hypothetical protein
MNARFTPGSTFLLLKKVQSLTLSPASLYEGRNHHAEKPG